MIGENIAAGYSTAKAVVDAWLCDESGGQCAADGTSAAGHRTQHHERRASDRRAWGMPRIPAANGGISGSRIWRRTSPRASRPLWRGATISCFRARRRFLLNYRDPTGRPPVSVQVVDRRRRLKHEPGPRPCRRGHVPPGCGQGGKLPRVLLHWRRPPRASPGATRAPASSSPTANPPAPRTIAERMTVRAALPLWNGRLRSMSRTRRTTGKRMQPIRRSSPKIACLSSAVLLP